MGSGQPEPTLLVPTEPDLGLEEAETEALVAWAAASSRRTRRQPSRLSPVTGFWPIFFLLVVLKIPVLGSIWLVWWASQATPEPEGATEDATAASSAGRGRSCRAGRGAGPTAAAPRCRCRRARRAVGPASSSPLRSQLSLAPDLAQVRMEVDLDRYDA